ncbi:MAG: phosphate ABC transporter substrate-binding protein [Ignavibacteria bacterium]|nr:phosphate ABC transporter substrate-binding protein [Ignavibacteria bacterium]
MRKILFTILFIKLVFVISIAKDVITIKGSDTMVILAQRWAEVYMSKNKNITIQVTGGGSGTGISALINGTTDICNSSRPMKREEKIKLKEKYGTPGVEIKVAIDGLAIYVNEKNPVKELSIQQIRDIYTGKINNWKEVGGLDAQIIRYSRENNSGTYAYFKDEVLLGADFHPTTQYLPGTAAVVNAIIKDKYGIGYGGAAFGKGIKELKIKKDDKSPAYAPTRENIKKGLYPISRYLYMYTIKRPEGEIKKFIDWILSDEGQKIVTQVGYYPIR